MDTNLNILNWNIKGINDRDKWLALKDKIQETNCDVICIQETKREIFDSRYLQNFCNRSLRKFDLYPSTGASGGIITIWKDSTFQGETLFKNEFSLSIRLTSKLSGEHMILSNIYGPCIPEKREEFLD